MTVDKEILDRIAEMEARSLLEGLEDPDLRRNPAFLEKVRKFLSQNKLQTTPETPGIKGIQKAATEIPIFEDVEVQ